MRFTSHARERLQQRGIPRQVVEVIRQVGRRSYNKGAEVYTMDKSAREKAKTLLDERDAGRMEKWFDCYIVMIGGNVITVARRGRQFKIER